VGPSGDALFPTFEATLSARFAHMPREERLRDLIAPLRHALGNAYKHGNGRCH
jgi:hypothetical protein